MTPEFGGHRDGVSHLSGKSKGEKLAGQAGAGEGASQCYQVKDSPTGVSPTGFHREGGRGLTGR